MKDQLPFPHEEEVYSSSNTDISQWWRSSTNFKECSNLINEINSGNNNTTQSINFSKITPNIKILREMERLALVAQEAGVDELRHKIYNYRCGDYWVPIGGIKKEDLDIPPVNTVLLVGFHNSGKSSVVNLMYSVLGRCGTMPFAKTTSGDATNNPNLFMEEHNVIRSTRSGFCVYDSRGFYYDQVKDFRNELSYWLTDGVRHKQLCLSAGDSEKLKQEMLESSNNLHNLYSRYARRRVNCVMMVVNVAEVCKGLKDGDRKPLEAIRELFCSPALRRCNENPILILTHGDKLTTEERIESRQKNCEYLAVSESTGVYDIVCITELGFVADDCDQVTAYAITEAVYRALLVSDRTHLPKKKIIDFLLLFVYWIMFGIGSFFTFLGRFFARLGEKHKI